MHPRAKPTAFASRSGLNLIVRSRLPPALAAVFDANSLRSQMASAFTSQRTRGFAGEPVVSFTGRIE